MRFLQKYPSPLLLSNGGYVSGMHAGTKSRHYKIFYYELMNHTHTALKDPTTSTSPSPSPPPFFTPYSQLHTPSPHITLLALSLLFRNHLCARFVLCLGLLYIELLSGVGEITNEVRYLKEIDEETEGKI